MAADETKSEKDFAKAMAADGLHIDIPEGDSHPFGIALRIEGRRLV